MDNIEPFQKLGWYTVPLKGELKRVDGDKKTIPIFPKNWLNTYQDNFCEESSKLGGVLTGPVSGIIALDCDDAVTYNIFKMLDPSNSFHFVGKGKESGTIIYRCPTDELQDSFKINTSVMHLDFMSTNSFIYLPTKANETKQKFTSIPKLRFLPDEITNLLLVLSKKSKKETAPVASNNYMALAPILEKLQPKIFDTTVFKIITPRDFRNLSQYIMDGYLHPNNVPDGRGSEYLSKVSAILGRDGSVNEDLYLKVIHYINEIWDRTLPADRLDKTIIDPMITGSATIDGEPIWHYDKNWKNTGLFLLSKLNEPIESFFDPIRDQCYIVNHASSTHKSYNKASDCLESLNLQTPTQLKRTSFLPRVSNVVAEAAPQREYGFFDDRLKFNVFKQSKCIQILNNPDMHKDDYSEPTAVLNFFESLVPNESVREYLFSFIKRKFTKFEYSPIVPYFVGVVGSGKDTFVKILEAIIGEDYVARPNLLDFLEKHNAWLMDKYIVQLDEYGNQITSTWQRSETLGKLKSYTGKSKVHIRQMRTDGFVYDHNATFILTSNKDPLTIEDGDRRILYIKTPYSLLDRDWVIRIGGISKAIDKIHEQVPDFCYYLATQVMSLSRDKFMTPPKIVDKHEAIAWGLSVLERLVYCVKNNVEGILMDMVEESGVDIFLTKGRIYTDDVQSLVRKMTDAKPATKSIHKLFRDYGYQPSRTKKDMENLWYINVKLPDSMFNEGLNLEM